MAIFGRWTGAKKPGEQQKKSQQSPPVVKSSPHLKNLQTPQHAAADSRNAKVPTARPARPDMHELVKREMTAPGAGKPIAPRLKSNKSWSAGDLTIASLLEQGPARHSSRNSTFNPSHRRPRYRSTASLARSPLSNTIVEEELSETTDGSPAGSTSSSDDGLEMKHDHSKLGVPRRTASSARSMPERVPEPLIEAPKTLQPNPPIKDKVDSFVDMPLEDSIPSKKSSSAETHVNTSFQSSRQPSTIFSSSSHLGLGLAPKSPTIDVFLESPKEDWFAENSRAFRTGPMEEPSAQQLKSNEEMKAFSGPENPIKISVVSAPATEPGPVLESCAPSLALESQTDVPVNDSPVLESRASSIDLQRLPRSRWRTDLNESATNSRSSSLARSEHQEYIARQANAYNTVLGHLYPSGRSITPTPDSMRHLHQSQRISRPAQPREGRSGGRSASLEPTPQSQRLSRQPSPGSRSAISSVSARSQWISHPMQQADASFARVDQSMNRGRQTLNLQSHMLNVQAPTSHPQGSVSSSNSSQRRVSSSPYREPSDGVVHISRYPSSRRASLCGSSPVISESSHEQDDFQFQPQIQPMPLEPPPIPIASKPRFVPTYVQLESTPRVNMQRHHTMDVYGHIAQFQDSSFTNYSNSISHTRPGSFDSSARTCDSRSTTTVDDRIAVAHVDSTYRQSRIDFFLNEHTETSSLASHDDCRSLSGSQYRAYPHSRPHSPVDRQRAYSMSSASHGLSDQSGAHEEDTDMPALFPVPSRTDSHRKLTQILGNEYGISGGPRSPQSPPAPLSERPLLVTEPLKLRDPPMVTRLEYPPSPPFVPDSEASSISGSSGKGKKVLEMPRGAPRKKKSFMGMLRTKSSFIGTP